jgi:hypothetical protein
MPITRKAYRMLPSVIIGPRSFSDGHGATARAPAMTGVLGAVSWDGW